MTITRFDHAYLDTLCTQARASPRLRQHRNVHTDYADPCQRVFNAITTRSYLVPHRHALSPRDETMLAVRGRLALVVFDEAGEVVEVVHFGAQGGEGGYLGAQGCAGGSSGMNVLGPTDRPAAGVLVPAGTWHTVLALDDDAILFETKAGPFDPAAPKEPAPWAPAEGTVEAGAYFARLRALVGG
ncbi:WbuC family cupin fold metalloprotein [Thauera sp. SWB20]|uniref:WbuC family cupin fold metalloprotein n=1 Tax=Thauera sp. SWB20 TaxID=1572758 RepID=UPI0005ADF0F9|nr:WbuC family cupin fold metalloprotein [Thauera sp. SWB20]KIN90041.1 cupin fold metallo, WbuC family protein [Thauera sp. SWB20]